MPSAALPPGPSAPPAPAAALRQGMQLQGQGRLREAAQLYRGVLSSHPGNADAWHLLGLAALQEGRIPAAEPPIRRALALAPAAAEVWSNAGILLHRAGDIAGTLRASRRSLVLRPAFPEALNNVGSLLCETGRQRDAVAVLRAAVALAPGYADAWDNLGVAGQATGAADAARRHRQRARRLRPGNADTLIADGNARRSAGDLDGAAACYRRALAVEPASPGICNNLANTLCEFGRFAEALVFYRRSLRRQAGAAEVHNNHGSALVDCGQVTAAAAAFRNAIVLQPGYTEAYVNAGNALQSARRITDSIAVYRRALRLQPGNAAAHSNLLMTMNYAADLTPADLLDAHRRFGALHGGALPAEPARPIVRGPERRLRIGYVSGDFRQHVASSFFEPVLAHHDRARFHVTCYSDTLRPDGVTARLQGLADGWCPIVGWDDDAVAARVRRDGIDILVDLAGHSGCNRLPVFARKPAPVQVTWLGYPNTTGLRAMDYRIVDDVTDPPGVADAFASETLLRLPGGFLCFQPPPWMPAQGSPPVPPGRPVVFGSFNNLSKVTEPVIRTWGAILRRLPGARLVLKSRPLIDAGVRRRLEDAFAQNGVAGDRLSLSGWTGELADHLAAYHGIDIALDPFPYNGTTTTCEALWMGVPVVTLRGDRHAARVGASLLSAAGLEELVGAGLDGYVDRAVALAEDRPRLNALKAGLRDRMAASPLCDGAVFTARLEEALRTAWRQRRGR